MTPWPAYKSHFSKIKYRLHIGRVVEDLYCVSWKAINLNIFRYEKLFKFKQLINFKNHIKTKFSNFWKWKLSHIKIIQKINKSKICI